MSVDWDVLIQGARLFDGSGAAPRTSDLAIADGVIAAIGPALDPARARRTVDARGLWALPGLLDIHTHYDLELELAPGLPESVRHGVTTVVISNCSLGLAFGAQRRSGPGADPIVDCFARVENIPTHVLRRAADRATWSDSREYLEHLDVLALGPNVVPMIPHSMLRIEVMGFQDSVSRAPRPDELAAMQALLRKGLAEGYAGFSTDALPFHYLALDPNRQKKIPTQYADYAELKALTSVVRDQDRVWQATPPKDSALGVIRTLLLTSGRMFGRPLRTTVVAALDIAANRFLIRLGLALARLLNSRLVRGRFALQSLPAAFKVWADGAITPIAEEIPALRELNELDLDDRAGRLGLLNDPAYVERFRAMWHENKRGPGRVRRWLRLEQYAFTRNLAEMTIDRCPVAEWRGKTLAQIHAELLRFQAGEPVAGAAVRTVFAGFPAPLRDEAEFLIHLLKTFDTDLIWHTTTANRNPARTRELAMHPLLMPGFNDSGAHLTNMAFYDGALRALKLAAASGEAATAFMVRRLTRDPAEFFNVDAGALEVGRRADVILIDPAALAAYDGEAHVERIYRAEFEHEQLVNRSDGVVRAVYIGGRLARENEQFTDDFGRIKFGRRLAPLDAIASADRIPAGASV